MYASDCPLINIQLPIYSFSMYACFILTLGAHLQRISRLENDYLNLHNCSFIHMYAHKPCFAIQIPILKILARFNRKYGNQESLLHG